jgi:hypothetical protein
MAEETEVVVREPEEFGLEVVGELLPALAAA